MLKRNMWRPTKETNAKLSLGIFISLCKTVGFLEPRRGTTQTVCHYHPLDSCCFIGCGAATLGSPTGPWMLTGLCYCQSLATEIPPNGPSKALVNRWCVVKAPRKLIQTNCSFPRGESRLPNNQAAADRLLQTDPETCLCVKAEHGNSNKPLVTTALTLHWLRRSGALIQCQGKPFWNWEGHSKQVSENLSFSEMLHT